MATTVIKYKRVNDYLQFKYYCRRCDGECYVLFNGILLETAKKIVNKTHRICKHCSRT